MDDPETLAALLEAKQPGCSNLNRMIRRGFDQAEPNRFEDIVAVNAPYRPGPMENIPLFIERKHGLASIDYLHEDLKDILEPHMG